MANEIFDPLEQRYGIPAGTLDRMWLAESSRGKAMLSPAGAQGHFGLMPGTAAELGVRDPNNLPEAADGAARYLSQQMQKFGDLPQALAAYNWGPGNLQRQGLDRAPKETRDYIQKVAGNMAEQDDPWAALRNQFAQGAAPAQKQDDPWEALRNQFAQPAPQQAAPQPGQGMPGSAPGPAVQTAAPMPVPAAPAEERNSDGALIVRASLQGGPPSLQQAPATSGPSANTSGPLPQDEGWATAAGRAIMDVPRQVGLTARYGLEGLGQTAQMLTEPLRAGIINPLARAVGAPTAAPTGRLMTELADSIGLPSPQNANERVVGDATRMMAGGGGMMGAARTLARGATGLTQTVLGGMAARPLQQVAGAVGAGLAGGAVREAGGGAWAQAGAGLLGGLAGPLSADLVAKGVNKVSNTVSRLLPAQTERVDLQIQGALSQAGVDWSAVPERIRQSVRTEAAQAMKTGDDLSPAALARLVDFKRVEGAVPTRGMLTLDPAQITRERNLAKTGANSSDRGLHGLARVENENNSALIRTLNNAGADAAPDAFTTGERVMGSLQRGLDAEKANINNLYGQARDSAGRSFPLDGNAFSNMAQKELADRLLGGSLPREIRQHINAIANGKVPFTVDYAEQLKTNIGNLQRGAENGNVRAALGVVRSALDETPVVGLGQQTAAAGARAVNPGNLPAIPGQPGVGLGEEAIAAFNQARTANRNMMQRIEESPALKAIYEGDATPDQFVNKFIVGPNASVKDVRAIKSAIEGDREATQATQGYIASWLKEKALGGRSDEIGAFSPANYNRALRSIGDRKLGAFFEPAEIEQLKAVGRVGDYMKAQPVGSAVNNSNSGALLMGRGLDLLDTLSSKVPLLGIGPTVQGVVRGVQQQSAQNVSPALLQQMQQQPRGLLSNMAPATMYGGLLSLPGIPSGNDDRRQ